MEPLAQRLRPRTLDEVCGQQHLLGKDKVFRRTIDSGRIPNMIFYGPSGVGKTTVAGIIAQNSGMHLHKLNGTTPPPATSKRCWPMWAPWPARAVSFCIWTRSSISTSGSSRACWNASSRAP